MNELIFEDYLKIKRAELRASMIIFLSKILNIDSDMTWNENAVDNMVDIACNELRNIKIHTCCPKYIDKDDTKIPCYKSDYCQYPNCIFKK